MSGRRSAPVRDAHHGERHRQDVALGPRRVVPRGVHHVAYRAAGERGGFQAVPLNQRPIVFWLGTVRVSKIEMNTCIRALQDEGIVAVCPMQSGYVFGWWRSMTEMGPEPALDNTTAKRLFIRHPLPDSQKRSV